MKQKRLLGLVGVFLVLSGHALEETRFKSQKFDVPKREVAIIVTEEGFYPENFLIFQGEQVHFYITATTELPSCFMIKGKEVFITAKKGEVTETNAYFDKPGKYEFFCPTNKITGKVTVIEHPEDYRKRKAREIASEKRVKVWVPRDE